MPDRDRVLQMVKRFHAGAGIDVDDAHREAAIAELLAPGNASGRIYLVCADAGCVGYLALCFGYSIELGGRDAFIDEIYVEPAHRGRGLATAALQAVLGQCHDLEVLALHLEVAHGDEAARRLYRRAGFRARTRYHLMTAILRPGG